MPQCEVCGNDYDKMLTVTVAGGAARSFDEKAIRDGWQHDIRIEQVLPSVGAGTPQLIDGARACPPSSFWPRGRPTRARLTPIWG
jgi:hypothetical protein